jgi:hypothetical protein
MANTSSFGDFKRMHSSGSGSVAHPTKNTGASIFNDKEEAIEAGEGLALALRELRRGSLSCMRGGPAGASSETADFWLETEGRASRVGAAVGVHSLGAARFKSPAVSG